jgi:hypothetical protein
LIHVGLLVRRFASCNDADAGGGWHARLTWLLCFALACCFGASFDLVYDSYCS